MGEPAQQQSPVTSTRFSLLANVALAASLLCSPCLLSQVREWFGGIIPIEHRRPFDRIGFCVQLAVMAATPVMSLVAVLRINRYRGALRGEMIAWAALCISLGWWGLFLIVLLFFALTGAGSPG